MKKILLIILAGIIACHICVTLVDYLVVFFDKDKVTYYDIPVGTEKASADWISGNKSSTASKKLRMKTSESFSGVNT